MDKSLAVEHWKWAITFNPFLCPKQNPMEQTQKKIEQINCLNMREKTDNRWQVKSHKHPWYSRNSPAKSHKTHTSCMYKIGRMLILICFIGYQEWMSMNSLLLSHTIPFGGQKVAKFDIPTYFIYGNEIRIPPIWRKNMNFMYEGKLSRPVTI